MFSKIDNSEFSELFSEWITKTFELESGQVIAVDGKRLRGSFDTFAEKSALHVVSAFAAANGIALGQKVCADKTNEITTIPELLKLITVKGFTITIDAMGCQKKIASLIVEKQADYILAVKDNQKELREQIENMFNSQTDCLIDQDVSCGHGRVETRICKVINNLKFLDQAPEWENLQSIIEIQSQRVHKLTGKVETERRFYISSLKTDAKTMNAKIRSHWGIENKLHRTADVSFKEDASRRRKGNSASNFNIIIKIASALINRFKPDKDSFDLTRAQAGWSCNIRTKILNI